METLEEKFYQFKKEWKDETRFLSCIKISEGLQKIIDLGSDIVPIILRDFQHENNHWHETLCQLVLNPPEIPEEKRGKMEEIRQIWLKFGREHGYI